MRLLPVVLLLLPLAGCAGEDEPTPTPTIAGVVTYPDLSHDHVTTHVTYDQHPPAGGPHWPPNAEGARGWQRCGVYTEPVVDEFAVHSLEHGAVWLTYRSEGAAAQLQQLAGVRPDYVLVSPYPSQASPVMATAWGLQLSVDSATDPRLADFVRSYAGGGQGGEQGADCANGSTIARAKAAQAKAGG